MNNINAFRLFLHLWFSHDTHRGGIFAKGQLKLGSSLNQTDGNLMQFCYNNAKYRAFCMLKIGQNSEPII